jgi:hypothetical protein
LNQKVLDIKGNSNQAGAAVHMWSKNTPPSPNQTWYLDQQGFIRSALNDMVLTNGGSGQGIKMEPASAAANPRSQWTLEGKKIGNRVGEGLDISRGNKDNGAEVISYAFKDQPNQHWSFEYV